MFFFSYHQKCSKCAFWALFKISLNSFDDAGKCILNENEKTKLSTQHVVCVKGFFFNFETMASEDAII